MTTALSSNLLIFSTSYSKATNENIIPCLRRLPSTKVTMKTVKHLIFFSMVSSTRRNFTENGRNDTVGTKQLSLKGLFVCKKARRNFNFYNKKSLTAWPRDFKFHAICRYVVRSKTIFWSTSYSACVVYTKTIIRLSVGESNGYLSPLR